MSGEAVGGPEEGDGSSSVWLLKAGSKKLKSAAKGKNKALTGIQTGPTPV